ncbi:MAG TPA: hypothetical protein VGN77_09180 [Steroidobacteraceae bacterium]|nr:hypothetical protein [Steroidobacteraceae bacterium]
MDGCDALTAPLAATPGFARTAGRVDPDPAEPVRALGHRVFEDWIPHAWNPGICRG